MSKPPRKRQRRAVSRRAKRLQDLAKPLQDSSPVEQWGHQQLLCAYSLADGCEDILETAPGERGKNTGETPAALIEKPIGAIPSIRKLIEHYIELRRATVSTQVDEASAMMALAVDLYLGKTIRKGNLVRARDAVAREFAQAVWRRRKRMRERPGGAVPLLVLGVRLGDEVGPGIGKRPLDRYARRCDGYRVRAC